MDQQSRKKLLEELWHGVRGPGKGGLVINDAEIAHVLIRWANLMETRSCPLEDCPACEVDNSLWWEWSNSLSGPVRIRMQRIMRELGIAFPPSPWEVVQDDVVPTA